MNKIIEKIDASQHIVLLVSKDLDAICAASALYTHILRLHKKVSFVCLDAFFFHKLSFIPWSEKIKNQLPTSADLVLCFTENALESDIRNLVTVEKKSFGYSHGMYTFFTSHAMKINEKMATALCCGLIYKSDSFANQEVDGTTFACMSKLIEAGASYATCHASVTKTRSLGALRFKAYVIENMDLLCDASLAYMNVNENQLLAYGVCEDDFFYALQEQLSLPSVKISLLVYENKALLKRAYLLHNEEQNLHEIFSGFEISGTKQQMCIDFAHRSTEEIQTIIIKLLKEGKLF
jgi:phosphoesterase RecJ-like protein